MSEENVQKQIALPWVSLCSDSGSIAPEAPFTNSQPHPRAYGSFARLLGKYVREEQVIPLEDAIHRMTGLPAANLNPRYIFDSFVVGLGNRLACAASMAVAESPAEEPAEAATAAEIELIIRTVQERVRERLERA